MSYQLTNNDTVIRLIDGAIIPLDVTNRDWIGYLTWLESGGVPEPAPPVIENTDPNYKLFLNLILTSNIYQSIVSQSTTKPIVNTGLTVTMGALILAASGQPNINGLQAGIDLLFGALTYTEQDIVELNEILLQSHLIGIITFPN